MSRARGAGGGSSEQGGACGESLSTGHGRRTTTAVPRQRAEQHRSEWVSAVGGVLTGSCHSSADILGGRCSKEPSSSLCTRNFVRVPPEWRRREEGRAGGAGLAGQTQKTIPTPASCCGGSCCCCCLRCCYCRW